MQNIISNNKATANKEYNIANAGKIRYVTLSIATYKEIKNEFNIAFIIDQSLAKELNDELEKSLNSNLGQRVDEQTNIYHLINEIHTTKINDVVWTINESLTFVKYMHNLGFLIMSINIQIIENFFCSFVLYKLHHNRCIIELNNTDHSFLLHKSIVRISKKYNIRINYKVKEVLLDVFMSHLNSWVNPHIANIYYAWNQSSYGSRFITFSLVNAENNIIASDIGIICGAVYTSLSGYTFKNNVGRLQLTCLILMLRLLKYNIFDFGMCMDYKFEYKATSVDSIGWINIFNDNKIADHIEPIEKYDNMNCAVLIKEYIGFRAKLTTI